MPETLFEKVWNRHVITATDEATLLYIDRHLVHEVTSPQAFDGLRLAGRRVRRPDLTFATVDHNVPTENQLDIRDPLSRRQVETLRANCREFGVTLYDIQSGHQGIVHVIGPELGLTLPGLTIVCGDSHTSTHGAFGALAFGIGTSEVEHVLATQTLWQGARPRSLGVEVTGRLGPGLEPKDIILAIIRQIGTGGATGPGHRVLRPGDRGAVDGRPDDDLQHVDRGRGPGRADRARRRDVRVHRPRRPALRAPRRRARRGHPRLEDAPHRRPLRPSTATSTIDAGEPGAAGDLGHQPGDDGGRHRRRPRARGRPVRQPRRRPPGPRLHGARPPARRSARSPSTSSSSARAPTAGSRTCAPPPGSSAAGRRPPASGR